MSVARSAATEVAGTREGRIHLTTSLRAQRHLLLLTRLGLDLLAANTAFFLAYYLRYIREVGGDVPGESFVEYGVYVPIQALFVALFVVGNQLRHSYVLPRGSSLAAEAAGLLGSSAVATMFVFALVSMVRYPASSRLIFVFAWALTCVLAIAGRLAVRGVRSQLLRRGYGAERVVVVGNNHLARMMMQQLAQQTHHGYHVVGFVDDAARSDFGRFQALGEVAQLPTLFRSHEVTTVIVALPATQHADILWVLDQCHHSGVSVSLVPDLFELRLSHLDLDAVGGIPLLRLDDQPIAGWNHFVKRALDVIVGTVLLVALAPFLIVVAIAIKLDSPGPILFRQIRLGKGGASFVCLKFRSMVEKAEDQLTGLKELNEADGPLFKMREDPRLTRVGKFIRRTSLDEFPQLLNVLRGEMSLVGPRPPIPDEVDKYEDWHRRRLEVVPGITGLWQVSGRSNLSFDEMVMLDIYYIENWSLGLDLQILVRTGPAVAASAGAF